MSGCDSLDLVVLRQLLRYDPETGRLFWLSRPASMFKNIREYNRWNTRFSGREAFTAADGNGYRHGSIFGRLYRAHRIIWALQTGAFPENGIDHKNGNRSDNRWNNLRAATTSQNNQNTRLRYDNISGIKGVFWNAYRQKWRAQIGVNGQQKWIGDFADFNSARAARAVAARKYHGEFARSPTLMPPPQNDNTPEPPPGGGAAKHPEKREAA